MGGKNVPEQGVSKGIQVPWVLYVLFPFSTMPRLRKRGPSVKLLLILCVAPIIDGRVGRVGRVGGGDGSGRGVRHRSKPTVTPTQDAAIVQESAVSFDRTPPAAAADTIAVAERGTGEQKTLLATIVKAGQQSQPLVAAISAAETVEAVETSEKTAVATIATLEAALPDANLAKVASTCDAYYCVSSSQCVRDWAVCSNSWTQLAAQHSTSGVDDPATARGRSSVLISALTVGLVSFVIASIGFVLLRFGSNIRAERLLWMCGSAVRGGSSRGRHKPLGSQSSLGCDDSSSVDTSVEKHG